jgi:uncharacterized protein with ParB-like and HNH nuclease domain
MFQRQYVWSADKQWQPLWEDIERKCIERTKWTERVEAAASSDEREQIEQQAPAEHFLGAIVLDTIRTFGNEVQAQGVIDGQQRLTTLQVFLAAFRDLVVAHSVEDYVDELNRYTRNTGTMADQPVERYKLWPTNMDQPAFKAVMSSGSLAGLGEHHPEVLKKHGAGAPRLAQAYAFFWHRIEDLLTRVLFSDRLGNQPDVAHRVRMLYETLQRDLQLVSIELEGRDDPQIIFETLNARGEPLLPSDLLRNYLFWRANRQKAPIDQLYQTHWASFDTDFWKQEEKQGRLKRPRVDLFFANLLQLKTAGEVNMGRLFYEYKEWSEKVAKYQTVSDELAEISRYAVQFEKLLKPSDADSVSRFVHMLYVLDVKTIFPLVMKLLADGNLPAEELAGVLQDLESYLVRRMICGLTTKNYNTVFIGWIAKLAGVPQLSRQALQEAMLDLKGEASLWPDDARFQNAWLTEPIYQWLKPVSRLEYVLSQLEIKARKVQHEDVTIRQGLTVEHILPQSWYEHWPLADGSTGRDATARYALPCAESEKRDRALPTLGNLTLLTPSANNSLKNFSFDVKVDKIDGYSLLALNAYVRKQSSWNEASIDARARLLFKDALTLWPYPATKSLEPNG